MTTNLATTRTDQTVSGQWRSRPADERYTSLLDLRDRYRDLRARSAAKVVSTRALTVEPDPADERDGLLVRGANGGAARFTHWSLGQVAGLAGAPAGYLRTLPAPLAADCVNYGLRFERDEEDVGVLLTRTDGDLPTVRAATGPGAQRGRGRVLRNGGGSLHRPRFGPVFRPALLGERQLERARSSCRDASRRGVRFREGRAPGGDAHALTRI